MPKKRNKKQDTAKSSQRRQAEIEARIKKAEANKAKKEAGAKQPSPKADKKPDVKPAKAAVQEASKAAPAGEPRRKEKPSRHRHEQMPKPRTITMTDAGDAGMDCRRYDCRIPERSTLESVMRAIRNDRPRGETGTIYISTDIMPAHGGHSAMSYEIRDGVFTRREKVQGQKKHPAPLLCDMLDRRVKALRASGGWGRMDWFIDLVPDISGKEPEPYDENKAMEGFA